MKTESKNKLTKIMIFALLLGVQQTANAFGTSGLERTRIRCTSVKTSYLGIDLELIENISQDPGFSTAAQYSAKFHSLHGPRLIGAEYDVNVLAYSVLTRVIVGTKYTLATDDGSKLELMDQTYPWKPNGGFTGTLTDVDQNKTALVCNYILNENYEGY